MAVISDGQDVRDLIPDDERITLFIISDEPRPMLVGDKRNLACSLILSDFIACWDDDDSYSPNRISGQMSHLISSGKSVTGCNAAMFTDGTRWWKYEGTSAFPDLAMGSSLCFRREWWRSHPFPSLQVGQDESFGYVAAGAGQLVTADAEESMIFSIHAKNTSTRDVRVSPWKETPEFRPPSWWSWPHDSSVAI